MLNFYLTRLLHCDLGWVELRIVSARKSRTRRRGVPIAWHDSFGRATDVMRRQFLGSPEISRCSSSRVDLHGVATASAGAVSSKWGQSALLARRLVEAGVRYVTLTFSGWDFHSSLERGMHSVLPILDATVGSLIEDLKGRGLLDSTVVIVMGEFGRTPRMNKKGVPGSDPVPGRDHWGNVMSVLVAGGRFRARTDCR
jgi:uncharacterized protein (DUF1501 family)